MSGTPIQVLNNIKKTGCKTFDFRFLFTLKTLNQVFAIGREKQTYDLGLSMNSMGDDL